MTGLSPTAGKVGAGPAATVERPALGPWARALRKLLANRSAMAALALFLAIVVLCLAAPFYANHVAHTDPFASNIDGEIMLDGQSVALVQASTEGLGLGS